MTKIEHERRKDLARQLSETLRWDESTSVADRRIGLITQLAELEGYVLVRDEDAL